MIGVLGPLQVRGGAAGEQVEIGSARHREVLAALVADAGRVVPTAVLLERVWGEVGRTGSTTNLHAVISRLRGRLREAGVPAEVATAPPGYRLDVEPSGVDALRFLDLLAAAREAHAGGDHATARTHVRAALALWRGSAYADIALPFAEAEAARLEGQRLAAVELGVELDLALGRHEEVVEALPALVDEQPLHEALRGHLMVALYRSGRQSDALAQYDDVRDRLAEELGLDPGPQLQALRQRILEQDRTLLAAAPAPTAPAGRLRSDVVVPASRLLGREADVAAVLALVEDPDTRLVTMTGPGGVGKTRLAFAVAQAALPSFRDGVVVVSLAPVSGPELVLPEIARALGLVGVEGLDPGAAVADHLRGRELLLVLDNLEHLLDAAAALSRLIGACPGLTVLVTSRTVLRVRGEVQYPVQPLPLPAADDADPGSLARSAAVSLFVDRARAAAPGFVLEELDPEALAAVGTICRRLSGLPLALELAAARVRLVPPVTMLGRLDEVMAAQGARDLPERQRTMRAALDWSHELLDEDGRQLLRRLSVCVDGFTLEAAEAVAGDLPVLPTLETLVEHSLVLPDPEASGVARFRMLEPVSQYAATLLTGEERLAARAAHRAHFRALAATLEPAYRGSGTISGLAETEREHANLVAAIESGLVDGDADLAGWLAWDLWLFWWLRGALLEGRRLSAALLEHDLGDEVRTRIHAVYAAMAFAQGDLATAREQWATGDALGERCGDVRGRSHNVAGSGLVALAEGDLDAAAEAFGAAVALCEESGTGRGWLWTLAHVWLGTVLLLRGDPDRATEEVEIGLAAARERHDPLAQYIGLFTAAQVALARGRRDTARAQLEEGVRLSLDTRDLANLAYFLDVLVVVEALDGEHRRALVLHGAALGLRETVGSNVYGYYKPDETMLADAVAQARSAVGADADPAVAEGRDLSASTEALVAYALRSR